MTIIEKTVIVPHSTIKMFKLISNINNYHYYLPWCKNAQIISQRPISHNQEELIGVIYIEYLKLRTNFKTKNIHSLHITEDHHQISFDLLEGPFTYLSGNWNFIPLGVDATKIEFVMQYKFSNFLLEKAIGPIFSYLYKHILDSFIMQANKTMLTER